MRQVFLAATLLAGVLALLSVGLTSTTATEFTEPEYVAVAALTATCASLYPEQVSMSDSERMTEIAYEFLQSIDQYLDPRENISASVEIITAQLKVAGNGQAICQDLSTVVLPKFGVPHRADSSRPSNH